MKKLILIMLLPFIMKGQIVVKQQPKKEDIGKVKDVEIYRLIQKKDTLVDSVYVISFKNEEYSTLTDYKSFFFKNTKNEFNDLYKILKSFYEPANIENKEYQVNFKLYKTDVFLFRSKKNICFNIGNPYFILGEKDIDVLFGKHQSK